MIKPKGIKWPKDKPIGKFKRYDKDGNAIIDLDPEAIPYMIIAKSDQDMQEEMK